MNSAEVSKIKNALALVVLLCCSACNDSPKGEVLFRELFPSAPRLKTLRFTAHGVSKGLTGNGEGVLVFGVSRGDFSLFIQQVGIVPESSSDPDRWDVEICNDAIAVVARSSVKITPSFKCYRQESSKRRIRIFYDDDKELAVVIARGYFGRDSKPSAS